MKPDLFFRDIVEPTLRLLAKPRSNELGAVAANPIPVTDEARVLVMAIAGQESRWEHRRQISIGTYYPQKVGARGYWQFESPWHGIVALDDVLQSTPQQIAAVCTTLNIPGDKYSLYEACAWNDTLACAMARLLLWRDPAKLPAIGDREGAWRYYLRNWKPGAPHRSTWDDYYGTSLSIIQQERTT